jgi:hypothetical protein
MERRREEMGFGVNPVENRGENAGPYPLQQPAAAA